MQQNPYAQPGNQQPNGYQGGYQPNGYQPNGYQPKGYQPNGYQPNGYQPNGYQPNGYQPNGYQPNGYQPNGYQPNQPQRRPRKNQKKKSNRTGLLLVGGIAAALIVVILIAVFSGVFASDEARLAKMEKTNAKLISEALSSSYGDYMESLEESLEKQEKGTGMEAEVKITANETFLENLITPMLGGGYSTVDMGWLSNVVLKLDVDAKGQQTAMSCGVGVNDKVLATIGAFVDLQDDIVCFNAPELNEQYLGMFMEDLDLESDSIHALQEPTEKLIQQMPSEKEVKKMLDQYLAVIFDYVEEVEKVKEKVTVGEQTKELTVLKVKITATKLAQMLVKLMEMAQEDETLKNALLAVGEYTVAYEEAMYGAAYSDKEDLYDEVMYELENAMEDIQDNMEYISDDDYIMMHNYTASGAIVGRKVELYSDGMKETDLGYYVFLPVGTGGVFEAEADGMEVSGSVKGKEVEINFSMYNRNMLTVVAKDVSFKDSVLNGTFQVMPSKALLSELDENVLNALKIGSQDTYLQIKLDGTAAKGTTALSVVIGGNEMIGISAQVKETKYNKINGPVDIIQAQSEYDLIRWANGIQFDKLTKNMTEAGVPEDYVQVVNELAMMLQMSGMLS